MDSLPSKSGTVGPPHWKNGITESPHWKKSPTESFPLKKVITESPPFVKGGQGNFKNGNPRLANRLSSVFLQPCRCAMRFKTHLKQARITAANLNYYIVVFRTGNNVVVPIRREVVE